MVLTGLYNLGKVPFHDVYVHAVMQDEQGRPFKKTLGNGFDPVDIIDFSLLRANFGLAGPIAIAFGADAVRVHDVREMARVSRMADAIVRG